MASVGSSRPLGLHSLTPLQPPARDPAEDPLPRLAPPSRCCRPVRSRLRRPPSSCPSPSPAVNAATSLHSPSTVSTGARRPGQVRRLPAGDAHARPRPRPARVRSRDADGDDPPRRSPRSGAVGPHTHKLTGSPYPDGFRRRSTLPSSTALSPPPTSRSSSPPATSSRQRPISPHISPYLPISPHISPYLPISPHISPYLLLRARAKGPQPCCCDVALPPQCHCYSPRRRAAPVLGRITILTRRRLPLVTCLNLRLSPRADRRPRRRHPLPQQARRLPARPRLRCLPAARASLTPLAVGAGFPLLLVSAAVYQLSSPASAIAVSTNLERATQFASLTLRAPPTPRPFPDPSPRTLSVAASRSSPAPWCSPAERCRARGGHLPPRVCAAWPQPWARRAGAGQAAPRAQRPRSVLLCSCSLLLLQARRRSELDGDAPAGGRAGGALQRCWSTATLSLL